MSNKKLWLGFTVLVLINLTLTLMLFFRKPPHHSPENKVSIKEMISQRLQFTDDQAAAYNKLITKHRKAILPLEKRLRKAKNGLYATLQSTNKEQPESFREAIAEVHDEIEALHYDHFLKIRELCTQEQMDAFDDLARDLGHVFAPKPPGKRGHRPKNR